MYLQLASTQSDQQKFGDILKSLIKINVATFWAAQQELENFCYNHLLAKKFYKIAVLAPMKSPWQIPAGSVNFAEKFLSQICFSYYLVLLHFFDKNSA